mmetsp:Transcript_22603/g.44373  ORF Transcript_22603/g.44373 Transcript_22603/m.44373 type:complete len:152 (-) Transcript_22603:548-1003(-)|eukprot:CAMPEP_0171498562 /NCGR_PEP_ID=MMETSP0958-20121227/7926_1 /TAXON_ID=87120 /ORGANISM="Aurantiochytrium limacinum, Strain ATCCMYA-1381" /LENGTH=151 /DNA_ID=CAMNT_0012032989 /DNA_START=38 /DNA_END=493 /DNA_ORIENTATION=-
MAKSRRKRSKTQARRFDPLSGDASTKNGTSMEGVDAIGSSDPEIDVSAVAANANAEGETNVKETRGQMEKRHHHELKQWRLEEVELRRERSKLKKKKTPQVDRERKQILQEIKDKGAALEKRHKEELQSLIEDQQQEQQEEEQQKEEQMKE